MSPDETKRLLAVAQNLKVRVLLSLGYGCGLRAGEVVRLKVKHIDSARKIIRIEQSKGRKDRSVMLSAEMLDLLRQWWKARLSRGDAGMPVEERWLFPGKSRGKPMTTRQLNRLFHQAADAAGIGKGMTLHRPAPQLCDPPAGTRHRYQSHPGALRNNDILPANIRSRDGSTIRSIRGSARQCLSSSNTPTVASIWSSFRSPTARSHPSPRG